MLIPERPLIGIGVIVIRDGKVLLGQRKSLNGYDSFGLPGGHLEYGESFLTCARRELLEETGLQLASLEYLCVSDILINDKHYVDIDFVADVAAGEPQVLEKNKTKSWGWYDINDPPLPLFEPAKLALISFLRREILFHDLVSTR